MEKIVETIQKKRPYRRYLIYLANLLSGYGAAQMQHGWQKFVLFHNQTSSRSKWIS